MKPPLCLFKCHVGGAKFSFQVKIITFLKKVASLYDKSQSNGVLLLWTLFPISILGPKHFLFFLSNLGFSKCQLIRFD